MDLDAVDDEKAEAALRREHLADQHAEQRQGEADPQPGDDLRRHGRRQDGDRRLRRAQAQDPGRAQQTGWMFLTAAMVNSITGIMPWITPNAF